MASHCTGTEQLGGGERRRGRRKIGKERERERERLYCERKS